jgi:hypothetical protein
VKDFSVDGWKRRFELKVAKRADGTTITVWSEGRDLFAHTGDVGKAYLLMTLKGAKVISVKIHVPD